MDIPANWNPFAAEPVVEGVVAGEHDVVNAEYLEGAQQPRSGGVAADGDVYVFADNLRHRWVFVVQCGAPPGNRQPEFAMRPRCVKSASSPPGKR